VDLVHDQLADGRHFLALNINVDPGSSPGEAVAEECLSAAADTSLSGTGIAREPEAVTTQRDRPGIIVSDNDTEFMSPAGRDVASR
jgi:putative transposase